MKKKLVAKSESKKKMSRTLFNIICLREMNYGRNLVILLGRVLPHNYHVNGNLMVTMGNKLEINIFL